MDLKRRGFFQLLGAGAGLAVGKAVKAAEGHQTQSGGAKQAAMGVLVDTTLCAGCRSCEQACNEANNLPKPAKPFPDDSSLDQVTRSTSPTALTVVNLYRPEPGKSVTRKQQCMHCQEPACSSACIIKAMEKRPEGPVTYREDLCIGCRYCMVACPFDVPKFEYDKAVPLVRKCQFCFERQQQGQEPACTEACPMGALKFGPREELLEEAKRRIYTEPDKYVHHIYGEHEAGGTSWLYLASVPFEQLGLPTGLGEKAYPELTLGAMGVVPMVMILWPALLMGLHHIEKSKEAEGQGAKPTGRAGGRIGK